MKNNRIKSRVICEETCHLHWNGSSYVASIINMSINGMGVHFDDLRPDVKISDKCLVHLIDNMSPHPTDYNCELIWINASEVGLKIIGIHEYLYQHGFTD